MSKNAKIWIVFAVTMGLYLVWKFLFNFWPIPA
jgi:hypothetical protein